MLTVEEKLHIINLKKDGLSYNAIGKVMHMKKPAIQKVIQRYGNTLKKRGPKRKITKFTRRRIRSFVNENNMNGVQVTCNKIKFEFKLNVHRTTVLRELKCLKYIYMNIPVKHMLTSNEKKKRVIFCKDCIIKNLNWSNVVFSDEKRFSLYGCDSYYSWFQGNKSPTHIRRLIRSPGVMVWGMITPNGLISFRIIRGKQNSSKYISLIKDVVIPISKLNLGNNFIYQQDNAPIHTSKETKTFMNLAHIETLNWPAYSPDLNIIENVWSLLSNIVYKSGYPKNIQELTCKINEAVQEINEYRRNDIINMYASIRNRLCEVIWRRGERVPY